MQIKHLTLSNMRGFEQAEFDFQPGMNLIVGIVFDYRVFPKIETLVLHKCAP